MFFPNNFQIEKNYYAKNGIRYIAGVDEVGRGPLAGPLVVAAVILNIEKLIDLENNIYRNNDVECIENAPYKKITDSKKVSQKGRLKLSEFIMKEAVSINIAEKTNDDIDREGMALAIKSAFKEAVEGLKIRPDFVISDAVKVDGIAANMQINLFKADLKSITVGAASIVAKVHRDSYMESISETYPEYDFIANKGYGTAKHLEALGKFGPCKLHRQSFHPICNFLK